jgi:hypothetical protein
MAARTTKIAQYAAKTQNSGVENLPSIHVGYSNVARIKNAKEAYTTDVTASKGPD